MQWAITADSEFTFSRASRNIRMTRGYQYCRKDSFWGMGWTSWPLGPFITLGFHGFAILIQWFWDSAIIWHQEVKPFVALCIKFSPKPHKSLTHHISSLRVFLAPVLQSIPIGRRRMALVGSAHRKRSMTSCTYLTCHTLEPHAPRDTNETKQV